MIATLPSSAKVHAAELILVAWWLAACQELVENGTISSCSYDTPEPVTVNQLETQP